MTDILHESMRNAESFETALKHTDDETEHERADVIERAELMRKIAAYSEILENLDAQIEELTKDRDAVSLTKLALETATEVMDGCAS